MVYNKNTKYWVIGVFIALFIARGLWVSYMSIRELKNDIKDRDKTIESIEKEKAPLLKSIKENKDKATEKDALILELSKNQLLLKNNIKTLRYENRKIKSKYINSPVNERIRIFAKLATEKNNKE